MRFILWCALCGVLLQPAHAEEPVVDEKESPSLRKPLPALEAPPDEVEEMPAFDQEIPPPPPLDTGPADR